MDVFKNYASRMLLAYAISSYVEEDVGIEDLMGSGVEKVKLNTKRVNESLMGDGLMMWEGHIRGIKIEVLVMSQEINITIEEVAISLCHNTLPNYINNKMKRISREKDSSPNGKKISSDDRSMMDTIMRSYLISLSINKLKVRLYTDNPTRRSSHLDMQMEGIRFVKERIKNVNIEHHTRLTVDQAKLDIHDDNNTLVSSISVVPSLLDVCLVVDHKSMKEEANIKTVVRVSVGEVKGMMTKPAVLVVYRCIDRWRRSGMHRFMYRCEEDEDEADDEARHAVDRPDLLDRIEEVLGLSEGGRVEVVDVEHLLREERQAVEGQHDGGEDAGDGVFRQLQHAVGDQRRDEEHEDD